MRREGPNNHTKYNQMISIKYNDEITKERYKTLMWKIKLQIKNKYKINRHPHFSKTSLFCSCTLCVQPQPLSVITSTSDIDSRYNVTHAHLIVKISNVICSFAVIFSIVWTWFNLCLHKWIYKLSKYGVKKRSRIYCAITESQYSKQIKSMYSVVEEWMKRWS